MRYTYRRISGALCLVLALFIISRFAPIWLWYFLVAAILGGIAYLLYNCFYF